MTIYRISIEWQYISNPLFGVNPFGHLYLVARESGQSDGEGYAISGYPDGQNSGNPEYGGTQRLEVNNSYVDGPFFTSSTPFGALLSTTNDAYGVSTTETERHSLDITEFLKNSSGIFDLGTLWQVMVQHAQHIANAEYMYDLTRTFPNNTIEVNMVNSNSLISSVLAKIGVNAGVFEDLLNQTFPGNDTILGGSQSDILHGYDNDDVILDTNSGNSNDIFSGGAGDDYLNGGGGDDHLYGEADNDYLEGGEGHDYLYGGSGQDIAYGGLGGDTFIGSSSLQNMEGDIYFGGDLTSRGEVDGFDTVDYRALYDGTFGIVLEEVEEGHQRAYYYSRDPHNEEFTLDENTPYDDLYSIESILFSGGIHKVRYGTGGDDTLNHLNPSENEILVGLGGNDTISGGGVGNDVIYGGDGDDILSYAELIYGGDGGDDTLYGNAGNDVLYGGSGNDILSGDAGNDVLYYIGGNDISYGGNGNDTVDFSLFNYAVWAYADESYTSYQTYVSTANYVKIVEMYDTENIVGSNYDDKLCSSIDDNIINGAGGADIVIYTNATTDMMIDLHNGIATGHGNDILTDYDPLTDALADFVEITDDGTDSFVAVDMDGAGSLYAMTQIATLSGITGLGDEDALVASGNLWI